MEIKTRSIARNIAELEPIIIKEKTNIRLIFNPYIVDQEWWKNVRWYLLYQKKWNNEEWEDYKDIELNRLKKWEYVKLELDSSSIWKIIENVSMIQEVYNKYWIEFWEKTYYVSDENIDDILEQVSKFWDKEKVVSALWKLSIDDIDNINQLVSITWFKNILNEWLDNKENTNEEFWQTFFTKHAWILSQIFSSPFILLEDKPYLWGKDISNKSWVYGDYLYSNWITWNIAFIEIKTPKKDIVQSDYGRNWGVYTMSWELTWWINQVLNQKDTFLKKEAQNQGINSYNSKCILLIWNTYSLDNEWKKKSFELFRNNLKEVDIITFDELFLKIEKLLSVFEDLNYDKENELEDLPF